MRLMNTKTGTTFASLALIIGMSTGTVAQAGSGNDYKGAMNDAWLDGKIETAFALNSHLNPFTIDTEVEDGMVFLDGSVDSDIDRDLAEQIALNIDGVKEVENRLTVKEPKPGQVEKAANDLLQNVTDATTTATVKSKLLANDNTDGLKINVDTHDNIVTLRGTVQSDEIRDLAEALAMNTTSVKGVENKLEVMNQ